MGEEMIETYVDCLLNVFKETNEDDHAAIYCLTALVLFDDNSIYDWPQFENSPERWVWAHKFEFMIKLFSDDFDERHEIIERFIERSVLEGKLLAIPKQSMGEKRRMKASVLAEIDRLSKLN
ncbi:MAG: hypothetical protein HQ536_04925 [Parcubacteria group bacterium]|nr:hypothetical protein [Parcubacteria group bacterium]